MSNSQLIHYIQTQLRAGRSEAEIKQILQSAGWSSIDIQKGFFEMAYNARQNIKKQSMLVSHPTPASVQASTHANQSAQADQSAQGTDYSSSKHSSSKTWIVIFSILLIICIISGLVIFLFNDFIFGSSELELNDTATVITDYNSVSFEKCYDSDCFLKSVQNNTPSVYNFSSRINYSQMQMNTTYELYFQNCADLCKVNVTYLSLNVHHTGGVPDYLDAELDRVIDLSAMCKWNKDVLIGYIQKNDSFDITTDFCEGELVMPNSLLVPRNNTVPDDGAASTPAVSSQTLNTPVVEESTTVQSYDVNDKGFFIDMIFEKTWYGVATLFSPGELIVVYEGEEVPMLFTLSFNRAVPADELWLDLPNMPVIELVDFTQESHPWDNYVLDAFLVNQTFYETSSNGTKLQSNEYTTSSNGFGKPGQYTYNVEFFLCSDVEASSEKSCAAIAENSDLKSADLLTSLIPHESLTKTIVVSDAYLSSLPADPLSCAVESCRVACPGCKLGKTYCEEGSLVCNQCRADVQCNDGFSCVDLQCVRSN